MHDEPPVIPRGVVPQVSAEEGVYDRELRLPPLLRVYHVELLQQKKWHARGDTHVMQGVQRACHLERRKSKNQENGASCNRNSMLDPHKRNHTRRGQERSILEHA